VAAAAWRPSHGVSENLAPAAVANVLSAAACLRNQQIISVTQNRPGGVVARYDWLATAAYLRIHRPQPAGAIGSNGR